MNMPFAYFEGKVVPHHEAKVSIASHSLQYGTTCFAGLRGYMRDGEVRLFRLKDHHERLMHASKIMGMDYSIPFDQFEGIMRELVYANAPQGDFYIRPFLYSSDEQLAPKKKGLTFRLAVYFVPFGHYFDPNVGMRMMVSSWRKFSDAALPTKAKAGGCYVNSFLATNEAQQAGYDEALMTNESGHIVEASVANLLLVHRGRVLSPPVGFAMLEGITMRTAKALLEDEGIPVHPEQIDRSMLYMAEELILTGTAAGFTFARSVDGREIGSGNVPGPFCLLLRERLQAVLDMKHPRSEEWVTVIQRRGHG